VRRSNLRSRHECHAIISTARPVLYGVYYPVNVVWMPQTSQATLVRTSMQPDIPQLEACAGTLGDAADTGCDVSMGAVKAG
jgi:hypothetical protein